MKRMMIILIAAMVTLGIGSLDAATLTRTISNTIRFTEDLTTLDYIDTAGRAYVNATANTPYGTMYHQNRGYASQMKYGAICADNTEQMIYVASKVGVHTKVLTSPMPFTTWNIHYDVYLDKMNKNGTRIWVYSAQGRSRPESAMYFGSAGDNYDRFPAVESDENGSSVYMAWTERITNRSEIVLQGFSKMTGTKLWSYEKVLDGQVTTDYNYSADLAIMGNYVYVVWTYGNNVYGSKIHRTTGVVDPAVSNIVIATTALPTLYPKIVTAPDNTLYLVWRNGTRVAGSAVSYLAQRLDANLAKVTWNGSLTNKIVSRSTSYYLDIDVSDLADVAMDTSTNLYCIWSARTTAGAGLSKVFSSKINCYNGAFTHLWGSAGTDVQMSLGGTDITYPDLAIANTIGYVSYRVSGGNAYIQKFTLSDGLTNTFTRYLAYGAYDTPLACFRTTDTELYANVSPNSPRIRRFNQLPVNNITWDRNYNTDKVYLSEFGYRTLGTIPGVIRDVKIYQDVVVQNTGAYTKYWYSPNGGATAYYAGQINPANGTLLITGNTNLSTNFRLYIIANNDSNNGINNSQLRKITYEAIKLFLGDISVGHVPNGSDAMGNIVINNDGLNQTMNAYVYNTNNSSAYAYFFIKNNGNISNTEVINSQNYRYRLKVMGNAGNANWDVEYWLCDVNGNTNRNITASITNAGMITNLKPFYDNEWMIIKVLLTPSSSLSTGSSFAATLKVYGEAGPDGANIYQLHDVAICNAVISLANPDLMAQVKGMQAIGYGIQSDGSGQEVEWSADTNVYREYKVHLRNAGGTSGIKVTGMTNPNKALWDISYYINGTSNVTIIMTNGTGITKALGNEAFFSNIIVKIRSKNNPAPINATARVQLTAQSTLDAGKIDKVWLKFRAIQTRPDVAVYPGTYGGKGLQTLNSNQYFSTNFSDNNVTNTFTLIVSNAPVAANPSGCTNMDLYLRYSISNYINPGWKFRLFYGTTNITSLASNKYYTLSNVAKNGARSLTAMIITPSAHNAGANEQFKVYFMAKGEGDTNFSAGLNIKRDFASIKTKVISSRVDNLVDGSGMMSFETYPPTIQSKTKYVFVKTNFMITVSNSAESRYSIKTTAVSADLGFTAAYTNNGVDITTSIQGAGWTANIGAGRWTNIVVTVQSTTAAVGQYYEAIVGSVSLVNPIDVDYVKYRVERAVPPDMQVRRSDQTLWEGDNDYGVAGQEVSGMYPILSTNWYQYLFKVENDRLVSESILLKATQSTNKWRIKYYRYKGSNPSDPDIYASSDWVEISSTLTNAGYTTNSMVAGNFAVYKLMIQSSGSHTEGDYVNIDLTGRGVTTGFSDSARVKITYGFGKADISYGTVTGKWNDIYATDYSQAVTNEYADKAKGSLYNIVIQNDSISNNGSFILRGTGSQGVWRIKYFLGGSDISAAVSSGGKSLSVDKNSNVTVVARVDASNSTLGFGEWTNFNIRVSTENDESVDYLRIKTTLTDIGQPNVIYGANRKNVYDSSLVSPAVATNINVIWGDTITMNVVISNERNAQEKVRVFGTTNGNPWNITYMTNTDDVTASVVNKVSLKPYQGGWDVKIPARSAITLKVRVSLSSNATLPPGTVQSFDIYTFSEGKLKRDAAKLQFTIVDVGRPDIASLPIGSWNNYYESAVINQILNTNSQKGWENETRYVLQNDSAHQERMKFKASAAYSNWQVSYFYKSGAATWNDISTNMILSNYLFTLPMNTSVTLAVKALLNTNFSNPLGSAMNVKLSFISWMGFVTDSCKISYTNRDLTRPDLILSNNLWNNVYEETMPTSDVTTNLIVERGDYRVFYFFMENDDSIRTNYYYLFGSPEVVGKWKVLYEPFIAGSYQDRTLMITEQSNMMLSVSPNAKRIVRVTVSINSNTTLATNSTVAVNLRMKSPFGAKNDYGAIRMKYVDNGAPDFVYIPGNKGDNTLNVANQTSNIQIEYGDTIQVKLILQNDRTDKAEKLWYYAKTPTGTVFNQSLYSVKIENYTNGVLHNVTKNMTNWGGGSRYAPLIPMNSHITSVISVTLASNCFLPLSNQNSLHLYYQSFGEAVTDRIVLNYKIIDKAKPNLYLINSTLWSNMIENGSVNLQKSNVNVEMGHTNVLYLYVQNGRAKGERFVLKTPYSGLKSSWKIRHSIFNGTSWDDITAVSTNSAKGWTNVISGNSRKMMRVEVYIPYDTAELYPNSAYLNMNVQSWMGYVTDNVQFRFNLIDPGKANIMKRTGEWFTISANYNDEPHNETIEKGITNSVYLVLTNERNVFDRFYLSSKGIIPEWNSKIFISNASGWSNMTTVITQGTFIDFTAREGKMVRVDVYADYADTNAINAERYLLLSMSSFKSNTLDKRKLIYKLNDLSIPDISVDGKFNNYYSFTGQNQATNVQIEKGETVKMVLKYENDSSKSYNYVLRAEKFDSNWLIEYNVSNGSVLSNVTYALTNSAGLVRFFTNGAKIYGEADVMLISNSPLVADAVFSNVMHMYTMGKLYIEDVPLVMKVIDRGSPQMFYTNGESVRTLIMKRTETNKFQMTVSNARTDSRFVKEDMVLKLNPRFYKGWVYIVKVSGNDVTAQTTNQGYLLELTNGLAKPVELTVIMEAGNTNFSGLTNTVQVEAYSQGRLKKSATKVNIIKQEPLPDMTVISLSGSQSPVGGDCYYWRGFGTNDTNQRMRDFVIVNNPAIYSIILENDDVLADDIEIKVEGDIDLTNKWEIKIESEDSSDDIKSLVKSGLLYTIPAGKSKMFIMNVKIVGDVKMNETNTIRFFCQSKSDTNKIDRVTIHTIRVPVQVIGKIYYQNPENETVKEPISGAKVKLQSKFSDDFVETTTTSEGSYSMSAIPGTYEVLVQRSGYVDVQQTVTVKELTVYSIDEIRMLKVNLGDDDNVISVHSFPNPVSVRDPITVLVNQPEDANLRIEVYDLQGKLLKSFMNEQKTKGVYTVLWDSRDKTGKYLSRGVYLLMVISGNNAPVVRKIFIK